MARKLLAALLVSAGVYAAVVVVLLQRHFVQGRRPFLSLPKDDERDFGLTVSKVKEQHGFKGTAPLLGQSTFAKSQKNQFYFNGTSRHENDKSGITQKSGTRQQDREGAPTNDDMLVTDRETTRRLDASYGSETSTEKQPAGNWSATGTLQAVYLSTAAPTFPTVTNLDKPSHGTAGTGQRYLIFVCDKKRSCGGWGDRQRGLVSVFLLSQITGRQFRIHMTKPCHLTQLYLPNNYSWIVSQNELRGKSVRFLDDVDAVGGYNRLLNSADFNREFPEDVIYMRTNVDYFFNLRNNKLYYPKMFPKWSTNSRSVMLRNGWKMLMKPSPHLQEHLDTFLEKVGYTNRTRPFVCVHFRMGRNPTIRSDSAVRHNLSEVLDVWHFVEPYVRNGSKFFLATDSEDARDLTRKRFGASVFDTGGRIVHVDKQAALPFSCEGFEVALLEQLVLMRCDVLLTSNSMFSYIAAVVRGTSDNLYRLSNNGLEKFAI